MVSDGSLVNNRVPLTLLGSAPVTAEELTSLQPTFHFCPVTPSSPQHRECRPSPGACCCSITLLLSWLLLLPASDFSCGRCTARLEARRSLGLAWPHLSEVNINVLSMIFTMILSRMKDLVSLALDNQNVSPISILLLKRFLKLWLV